MTTNYERCMEALGTASALIAVADNLSTPAKDRLNETLLRVRQLEMLEGQLPPGSAVELSLDAAFNRVANLLDQVMLQLSGISDNGAREWAAKIDEEVLEAATKIQSDLDFYIETEKALGTDPRPSLRSLLTNATIARRVDLFLADTERLGAEARESVQDAKAAASQAQVAAGTAGEASLSTYFATYARQQLQSSNLFRLATILTIIAAIVIAVSGARDADGDVTKAIYHVAIVAGIAGLATYFGRQSGHHRRVGTWAKAVQIQLQSFPAFMAAIPDDKIKGLIYEAFAKRVLGAPPEASASSDTSAEVLTQPLIDAVLRRATS